MATPARSPGKSCGGRHPWAWLPTTWLDHLLSLSTHPDSCRLVEPAADLDGDRTADLVWSFQDLAASLAVSGKDGSILWDYTAALDGPGDPRPSGPDLRSGPSANHFMIPSEPPEEPGGKWRRVIGTPEAADVDGDGVPDLIATMTFSESKEQITLRTGSPPDPNSLGH